jgi:hypothetical protein
MHLAQYRQVICKPGRVGTGPGSTGRPGSLFFIPQQAATPMHAGPPHAGLPARCTAPRLGHGHRPSSARCPRGRAFRSLRSIGGALTCRESPARVRSPPHALSAAALLHSALRAGPTCCHATLHCCSSLFSSAVCLDLDTTGTTGPKSGRSTLCLFFTSFYIRGSTVSTNGSTNLGRESNLFSAQQLYLWSPYIYLSPTSVLVSSSHLLSLLYC